MLKRTLIYTIQLLTEDPRLPLVCNIILNIYIIKESINNVIINNATSEKNRPSIILNMQDDYNQKNCFYFMSTTARTFDVGPTPPTAGHIIRGDV